jgi:hypothetical protein
MSALVCRKSSKSFKKEVPLELDLGDEWKGPGRGRISKVMLISVELLPMGQERSQV